MTAANFEVPQEIISEREKKEKRGIGIMSNDNRAELYN